MAFTPSFLDELRTRLSLVSVIGRKVRLARKGREHMGLCPFHNEKSPSFTVNEEKGFYHCFGCGAHGDVITFEMQTHHLSFPEAVEKLAGEAGLEVPVQAPEERERAKRAASLYDAMEVACAFFEKELRGPNGHAGLEYLRGRGLDDRTIARFRLGFSPDSRTALKHALKGADISEAQGIEGGLLKKPEGGGDSFDMFRGRVMFPISDRRGRVIAFGARTLGDGQPKYLNSPDTPLFHKGSVLYGLAQAREPAMQVGSFVVSEGYMDVIALHRAGFTHAVAPLGTALTEQQIEMMWTMVDEPIVCLDGDAAGQRAASRAAERALTVLKPGKSLRFAQVPAPEDPDSLIRQRGPAAMQEVLDQAEPLSDMLWRTHFASHPIGTPEQRQGLERDIRHFFEVVKDEGLRKDYGYDFVQRARDAVRRQREASRPPFIPGGGGGNGGGRFQPGRPGAGPAKPKTRTYTTRDYSGRVIIPSRPNPLPQSPWTHAERLLLLTAINHPHLIEEFRESLGHLQFADSNLDKLRQEVLKPLDGWGSLDFEGVQDHLRSCGFSQILDCLLEASSHVPAAFSRPDAPLEEARAGWEELFKQYMQKELTADLQQAEQALAQELTADRVERLNALVSSKDDGGDQ